MTRQGPRVLVTGSAGKVGGLTLPSLRSRYRLRLLDLVPQVGLDDDEVVQADITDTNALEQACQGVRAVVHLAAQPNESDFATLVAPNLIGVWSVFEAAVRAGVDCVVFTSSVQTHALVPKRRTMANSLPRPPTLYGATKVFGEAVARYYVDHQGIRAACLRVGRVESHDAPQVRGKPLLPRIWCGPKDLATLMISAIDSCVPFATVFAVSKPATMFFDISNPYGWRPVEILEGAKRRHLAASRAFGLVAMFRGRR